MGAFNFLSKQNNLLILKKLFQGLDEGAFNLMLTVAFVCFASSDWKLLRKFFFPIPTFTGTEPDVLNSMVHPNGSEK